MTRCPSTILWTDALPTLWMAALPALVVLHPQDATYSTPGPPVQSDSPGTTFSTPGPPTQSDPQTLPSGVGYGGTPQIVSSAALMTSSSQPADVHYHMHGPAGDGGYSPYSGETFAQVPVAQNWQWNYYSRTGANAPGMAPMQNTMTNNASVDNYTLHVYDNGAGSGFIPAIDNRFAGSGDFIGNFDPYAFGGAGYVQGFD